MIRATLPATLVFLLVSGPALAGPWSFEKGAGRDGAWASAQATDVSGLYELSVSCWMDAPAAIVLSLRGSFRSGSLAPAPMTVSIDSRPVATLTTSSIANITSVDSYDEPELGGVVEAMRDAAQLIRVQSGLLDTTFTAEGALDALGELGHWCG